MVARYPETFTMALTAADVEAAMKHGKIASMEGIYFESSSTTDYHFLTVADVVDAVPIEVRRCGVDTGLRQVTHNALPGQLWTRGCRTPQ